MHSVARLAAQRLGREVGGKPVAHRHGMYDGAECHGVVRRLDGVGVPEVDLVLSRSLLVVRAFRADAHLLERKADLAPDVFALVLGRDVHVSGAIVRDLRRLAAFVAAEKIKLHLGTERKGNAHRRGVVHRFLQQSAYVPLKRRPVRVQHTAEKPRHAPVVGPPRQQAERRGIRLQKEIRVQLVAEAGNGGGVERDAGGKRPVQRVRQNGHILLFSRQIEKRHP